MRIPQLLCLTLPLSMAGCGAANEEGARTSEISIEDKIEIIHQVLREHRGANLEHRTLEWYLVWELGLFPEELKLLAEVYDLNIVPKVSSHDDKTGQIWIEPNWEQGGETIAVQVSSYRGFIWRTNYRCAEVEGQWWVRRFESIMSTDCDFSY